MRVLSCFLLMVGLVCSARAQEVPAANSPAVALPEVALPALPTPNAENASDQTLADKVKSGATLKKIEPKKPAFDDFGASIFYKAGDIEKVRLAYVVARQIAERPASTSETTEELVKVAAPVKPVLQEYPVFYLSSLVVHGRGAWVMWLNGQRVTPRRLPPEIEILGINTQQVRLRWRPTDFSTLSARWQSEQGKISASSARNRLSAASQVKTDQNKASVDFTLRPYQTYSSAYNAVFEGKMSPEATGLTASSPVPAGAFEQTLRAGNNMAANGANQPRVIKPSLDATVPRITKPRASGLTKPDSATIKQIPSIFPGGVPPAATAASGGAPTAPLTNPASPTPSGMPIMPPTSGGNP